MFGRNYRIGYVKLYQMKLELLQKGQIVGTDILQELENMDKECDIDDILNYRTIAEQQLQVVDASIRRTCEGDCELHFVQFSH